MQFLSKKMMMKPFQFKAIVFLLVACFLLAEVNAQRDTVRRQTIEITSAYKPELRNTVKINLYASAISADTSRPRMAYNIPPQNLFFTYQPASLKPLALEADTSMYLGNRKILKLGFGNLTTPYISGAFSFGDAKTNLLNVYGDYISSRGKIKNQDFSEINLKGMGSIFSEQHETYAGIGFAQHEYYQYGYDHNIHTYDKETIRRSYQDLSATVGFKNIALNDLGINYNPHIEVHAFSRESKASESTLIINLPVEKTFGESVTVKVTAMGNFNQYKIKENNLKASNNLFQLAPELIYTAERFKFHGGITPSWNNNTLAVLPNLYGEAQLQQNVLTIQAGWIGRYIANSFRTLSGDNPYLQDPVFLKNTKETQYYGGIKATISKHFNFNAKAAFISYKDMPLFINDNFDGKTFIVSNESSMKNLQIHGDMNFINQDKFTVTAGLDLNSYTGLKDNSRAWGLYPLKLNGSLRWHAFDQLLIKSDLIAFSGGKALLPNNDEKNMKGGTDLSAGAEFKINKQFSAWLDFNNIFNSKYERWSNYPVYGFQVIGGVIVRF